MEGLAKFPDKFERCVIAAIAVLLAAAVMTACSADTGTDSHVPKRFEYSDDACSASVIVDTETGVQYLCVRVCYGVSVTPLLDQWGFPLLAEGYQRGARVGQSQDVDSKELVDDDPS